MVAIWYLLVLAPFIAIPVIWWNYRRKHAMRESLARARLEEIINRPAQNAAAAPNISAHSPSGDAAAAADVRYTRRERLLDPAETVVYLLLKSALPECEILSHVALARVLDLPAGIAGSEREQRMRALSQHVVDFVICNKAMQPVAVIDLPGQETPALTTAPDFRTQCLAHTGIRHLRWPRTAIPKRQDVRALVLGG